MELTLAPASRSLKRRRAFQELEKAAGQVTLQAACNFPRAPALTCTTCSVGLRLGMTSETADDDGVQCGVELAITGAVESVALYLAEDRSHPCQSRKGRFAPQTADV